MYKGIENDSISQLIKDCQPLRVKINVETIDSCTVIFVDGRSSYSDPANWDTIWNGFAEYIHLLMCIHGINYISSTKLAENYYSFNLGSVFDMIRNAATNE